MDQKVYVSGLGAISAIGNNVEEQYESLINKRSGIGEISILKTVWKGQIPAAEIKYTDDELLQISGANTDRLYTRTELIGIIAVREAMKDAGKRDLEMVDAMVNACFDSDDYKEGRKAFMEKRKPDFSGR